MRTLRATPCILSNHQANQPTHAVFSSNSTLALLTVALPAQAHHTLRQPLNLIWFHVDKPIALNGPAMLAGVSPVIVINRCRVEPPHRVRLTRWWWCLLPHLMPNPGVHHSSLMAAPAHCPPCPVISSHASPPDGYRFATPARRHRTVPNHQPVHTRPAPLEALATPA